MLYDVVPPLLFFGSLGGIIFIISRVVTRLRRHELTTVLETAAAAKTPTSAGVVRPSQSNIRLFASRLSVIKPRLSTIGAHSRRVVLLSGQLVTRAWQRIPKKLPRLPRTQRVAPTSSVTPTTLTSVLPPKTKSAPQPAKPHITKKVVSPTFFQKKPRLSELEAAETALQQKNYTKVEETLVPYLFKHPANAQGYILLGKAAMQQGNWSDALEIFEQAAAQDKPPAEAQALVGISAYNTGQLARALPALQRAHDQDPANQEVLSCLMKIARTTDNRALVHSIEVEIAALQTPSQTVATN